MKQHTSFKIGGPADVFVVPDTVEKCQKAITLCRENNIPYMIIGKGSNLLVSDSGISNVVICILNSLSEIKLLEDNKIKLLDVTNFENYKKNQYILMLVHLLRKTPLQVWNLHLESREAAAVQYI